MQIGFHLAFMEVCKCIDYYAIFRYCILVSGIPVVLLNNICRRSSGS